MKLKFRVLLSMILCMVLLVGVTMPVSASTVITESGDQTASAVVTVADGTIVSTYSITVPNAIPMTVNSVAKTATKDFTITVSGDIAGNEVVNISAIKTFNLTQAGQTNVPVTLLLSKDGSFGDTVGTDTFSVADDGWKVQLTAANIASSFNVSGRLNATNLKAGAYSGTASFKASLE